MITFQKALARHRKIRKRVAKTLNVNVYSTVCS